MARHEPRGGSVKLYFLRHGDAEPSHPDGDEARALTDAGIATLRAAAPIWRRLHLRPDVVLTSPLVRAVQTAELLSSAIDAPAPVVDDRLRPGACWDDVAAALAALPPAKRVAFVGHEPDFSTIVAELTGAASVKMRKGGLACVRFPGAPETGAGEIAWLLDPDIYADDAGD